MRRTTHGRQPRVGRRAFTFIEVLATLVLIGIVLPVAMKGIGLALSAASLARSNAEAVALADTKLNEIVATAQWDLGAMSGDFEPDFPGYQWTAEVYEAQTDLIEITVHVTWPGHRQERRVSVTTMVYTAASYGLY